MNDKTLSKPDESLDETPPAIEKQAIGGHGHDNRGLEAGAIPGMGYGRFGRMFGFSGRPLKDDVLLDIARAMVKVDVSPPISETEEVDENPVTSAGYTYFGQFVDHDITFDPSPISVDRIDIAALEDFRTPALDLDCLYGRGPDDQPYLYHEDGLRLREGAHLTAGTAAAVRDLPRVGAADGDKPARERALIGDKRNDENRIVAMLHAAMIRVHNKVVVNDDLIEQFGGNPHDPLSRFRAAVNCVRWHYQWLVVNDFLGRHLLKPGLIEAMIGADGAPKLRFYDKAEARFAYMPVEFAGAAYRVGHSMVRPGYSLNSEIVSALPFDDGQDEKDGRIPIFNKGEDRRQNLNGFGFPMPKNWGIDWSFFFNLPTKHLPEDRKFVVPQPSYRLDAMLVAPLSELPEFFGEPDLPFRMLAFRNLRRGTNVLQLPSGEQVARAIGETALTPRQLWQSIGSGKPMPKLDEADEEFNTALLNRRSAVWAKWQQQINGNTPLWYYVLREAELLGIERAPEETHVGFGGQHLGPVGSTIIAETFLGLLWRDEKSYLRRWPAFQPVLPQRGETFDLGDLLLFANQP